MKTNKKSPAKEDFIIDSTCLSYRKPFYNGLTDPNLSSFFASPRRRKLLIKQKLITHTGEINEKLCLKHMTNFNTQTIRKASHSPNLPKKVTKNYLLTPEEKSSETKKTSMRSEKLPSIHPMTSKIRKASHSPNLPNKVTKNYLLTPEEKSSETKKTSMRSEKLPSIHPMTSMQFKEMLNKRRTLVTNQN
ncbi:hypothetical protein SteCoe_28624 [Stentor coeruleus]|uniref:Uncharacterized protein n=1 Tax=Stentor coeruleus TaxID=5963 RepID=A0A1R2B7Q1_9CILI|nr:hypothetical protein SteCoe_28624 [Stentor coeruleus]